MPIEYITTRELANAGGEAVGKVRILKQLEEGSASVVFKCPECKSEESSKEEWSEPFVVGSGANQSFNLKCKKCGYITKISKLKKEIKKKK